MGIADFSAPVPPRTTGGILLRQALDDAKALAEAEPPPTPGHPTVTAFVAYDKDTGAQLGGAFLWRGEKGSEWSLTGALSRKVQAAQAPYAVRLELRGRL